MSNDHRMEIEYSGILWRRKPIGVWYHGNPSYWICWREHLLGVRPNFLELYPYDRRIFGLCMPKQSFIKPTFKGAVHE